MESESSYKKELAQNLLERENTVLIDRPDLPAKYKLIYSHHDRQNNPKDLEFNDEKPDCIVLERGRVQPTENGIKSEMSANYHLGGQYKEVIKYIAQNNIPLYLIDYNKNIEKEILKKGSIILPALSMTGSFLVINSLIRNDFRSIREEGMTRRSFFKTLGKSAMASYLSLPVMEMATFAGDEPNEKSTIRKIHRTSKKLMTNIQPWSKSAMVHGRNIIFAMLLDNIAEKLGHALVRKPNIPFVVGGEHFEIESEIGKSQQELMVALSKYVQEKTDPSIVGSIIKVEFQKNANKDEYSLKVTLPEVELGVKK